MNELIIQFKKAISLSLIVFALGSVALSPMAHAVSPAPDGGYPGFNTAEGTNALKSLTTGIANVANGWFSLFSDTDGSFNTAVGAATLLFNLGDQSTGKGVENTAVGAAVLLYNTTGSDNTATGAFALFNKTTGAANNAVGTDALKSEQTGFSNNALGAAALFSNVIGRSNTAVGDSTLYNTTGNDNTALGNEAGANATTGDGNIYIGAFMLGVAGESNHTYIGNINTTSVSGGGADYVTVDLSTGLLGHLSSSRRYKEDIIPMNNASEALYRLKPVIYRYKKEIDPTQSPAFGLIAEEVAKVDPDLVACNAKGQPESVHYEMVNAMLLNEFLKEHKKVEEQQATITELKLMVAQQQKDYHATTAYQQKQINALSANLQKVGAQIEARNPTSKVVLNDR